MHIRYHIIWLFVSLLALVACSEGEDPIIEPTPSTPTEPSEPSDPLQNVWHVYPIRTLERDRLREYLSREGIETMVHYPVPPHKQKAYSEWNDRTYCISEQIHREILSLPISQVMKEEEVKRVIETLNSFTL